MSTNGRFPEGVAIITVVRVTSGIHVAVVDRYLTFADTLAAGLRPQDDVLEATSFTDTESLWQALQASEVDLVLLDSDLLRVDSSFLQRIREDRPKTRVVVISNDDEPEEVVRALASGAAGWSPKSLPFDELLRGLRAVVGGETWIPGRLLTTVLEQIVELHGYAGDAAARLGVLTPREREILQCLVDGMGRPQIAARLGMSPNTVRTHVHNLLHKLGAHSSLRAVAIAREAGLAATEGSSAPSAHPSTTRRAQP